MAILRGLDNSAFEGGIAYLDYRDTAPWPTIEGNSFTTPNGLRLEFLEPGKQLRITYTSPDGAHRT